MFNINFRCVSTKFAKLKNDFQCLSKCATSISTSCTLNKGPFELERQAKMLNKLMSGSRKKWPSERDPVKKPGSSVAELTSSTSRTTNRRGIYNNILIRSISDLMSTGDLSHHFVGKGIEITGVKTTSDLSCAKIFYCCSSVNVDYVEMGALLNRNAITLRSQLSNLYILGKVPQLIFVRDVYYERKETMEHLFAIADYGPDEPAQPSDLQVASTEEEKEEKEEVAAADELVGGADVVVEPSFIYGEQSHPKLKSNLYELERHAMMVKVKNEMCIFKANSRLVDKVSEHRTVASVELSTKSRVEKLADFIKQQKRMKLKNQQDTKFKIDDGLTSLTPYYNWQNEPDILSESGDNYEFEDFEIDVDHKK